MMTTRLVGIRWRVLSAATIFSLSGHQHAKAEAFTTASPRCGNADLMWNKSQSPHHQQLSIFRNSAAHDLDFGRRRRQYVPIRGGGEATIALQSTLQDENNIKAQPSSSSSSTAAYSYYLLWSPGFAAKFASTLLGLTVLQLSGITPQLGILTARLFKSSAGKILPQVGSNIVLPLLSSSCCLIQLGINMVVGAGGCAGFNTALGPFRPFFLSLLAFMTIASSKSGMTTPRVALLRGGLALLPEVVHFWNEFYSSWRNKQQSAALASSSSSSSSSTATSATLLVDIPTMGCVACVNKIDSSLRGCAPQNIGTAKTWLDPEKPKGGKTQVEVMYQSEEELDTLKDRIVQTIESAGFSGSSVVNIEVNGGDSSRATN